jgi:plasmid stability protein
MASITIHNLDPALKESLRVRAAERGHSMEAEVRRLLETALRRKSPGVPIFTNGSMPDLRCWGVSSWSFRLVSDYARSERKCEKAVL